MQSFEFGPSTAVSLDRPSCHKCHTPMMTVRVEPLGDGILRTFACPQCDHFERGNFPNSLYVENALKQPRQLFR